MANRELIAGPACTFNGWIGQLSVQATDFSILAIGIATMFVVTRQTILEELSRTKRTILCLTVWVMPVISSTTVTALGEMKPVSGNWCWISQTRPDLRYGVAHGWRFLIIFLTICIYVYIYQYLGRHFRSLAIASVFGKQDGYSEETSGLESTDVEPLSRHDTPHQISFSGSGKAFDQKAFIPTGGGILGSGSPAGLSPQSRDRGTSQVSFPEGVGSPQPSIPLAATRPTTPHQSSQRTRRKKGVENEIKRMLLLNGYPVMYILLWIPGLTNRAMEASGKTSSSEVLAALQCSTQFIGFANAVTYGLNREMRQTLWRDLRELFHAKPKIRLGSEAQVELV